MSRNFLQYWKPAKAKYELGRVEKDEPMNHTAGEQLYKVRPDEDTQLAKQEVEMIAPA